MSRPTRKMVNLSIEETSGVDHPAHLHEGWLVMKAADSDDVRKAMQSNQEAPMDNEMNVEDVLKEAPDAVRKMYEDMQKATDGQSRRPLRQLRRPLRLRTHSARSATSVPTRTPSSRLASPTRASASTRSRLDRRFVACLRPTPTSPRQSRPLWSRRTPRLSPLTSSPKSASLLSPPRVAHTSRPTLWLRRLLLPVIRQPSSRR